MSASLQPIMIPQTRRVYLLDLESDSCRWPVEQDEDGLWTFCGEKAEIGQTYCRPCRALAYVPLKPRAAWRSKSPSRMAH